MGADSSVRGVLKQMIDGENIAKTLLDNSIIILESNLGWRQITEMSDSIRGLMRKPQKCPGEATFSDFGINFETVQRILKDQILASWKIEECPKEEEKISSLYKSLNSIDLFVPFLPLRKEELQHIIKKLLDNKIARTLIHQRVIEINPELTDFLIEKITFDKNGYAINWNGGDTSYFSTCYIGIVFQLLRN